MRLDHLLSMENVLSAKEQESVFEIRTKRRREIFRKTVVQFSRTDGNKIVGLFNAQGPPVPIPNTEVKLCSAENTLLATVREDRSGPTRYGGLKRVRCDRQKDMRKHLWGCSSAGRAPALQAGGHGFESHHLHQSRK